MPSLCCLSACPNSSRSSRRPNVKYFRIPAATGLGDKWRAWIFKQNGMFKLCKVPLLCEEHFPTSFILPNGRLVTGALPSTDSRCSSSKPTDLMDEHGCEKDNERTNITLKDLLDSSEEVAICNVPKHPNIECLNKYGIILTSKSSNVVANTPRICETRDPIAYLLNQNGGSQTKDVEPCDVIDTPTVPEQGACAPPCASSKACCLHSTPQSRTTIGRKRYVGDLQLEDFTTPCKAAKHLELAKTTVKNLQRKIKAERGKNFKLRVRIKALQNLLNQVGDKRRETAEGE